MDGGPFIRQSQLATQSSLPCTLAYSSDNAPPQGHVRDRTFARGRELVVIILIA
jgi:hypothetical protein